MKAIIDEKINLFKYYGVKKIGLSLLFSIVLATLIVAPFIALGINLLLIYVRFVYLLLVIINVLIGSWVFLTVYWFYDTLKQYDKNPSVNLRGLFMIDVVVKISVVVLIGFILIIVLTPNYIT